MIFLPEQLTGSSLRAAARELAERDPDLRASFNRLGPPPLWDREPGFPTLVRIVLEQQVSLASAQATFRKLVEAATSLEPSAFLALDDAMLETIGFSHQKRRYCRELAEKILGGSLDLEALRALPDENVRNELTAVAGIGRWTADVYILMALRRPDIWPQGDLALRKAMQDLKGLPSLPSPSVFESLGEPWRPWRSVAARMLWHHYLNPS